MAGYNRHHLLFTRKAWVDSPAKRLRESLVFSLPVEMHEELHRIVPPVPLPPEKELRRLWRERCQMPRDITIGEAMRWLLSSAEDIPFLKAISAQYVYLAMYGLL